MMGAGCKPGCISTPKMCEGHSKCATTTAEPKAATTAALKATTTAALEATTTAALEATTTAALKATTTAALEATTTAALEATTTAAFQATTTTSLEATTTTALEATTTATTTAAPTIGYCTASCDREFANCFGWHSRWKTPEQAYSQCRGEINTGYWRLKNAGCKPFCLSTENMCANHRGCATQP